jgi:putative tryptophan/tyrosine transport system substrate-binding protein
VCSVGAAAAWPLASLAQQPAMPVIGFLHAGFSRDLRLSCNCLSPDSDETGYFEGQNVAVEYQWAEDRYDQRLKGLR